MVRILTYNEIDKQQWQALVDRSPYATWFQTKEAYEFYAANPDEMTPFAIGVEEKECKVESLKFKGEENSEAETTASTPYTLHPTPALKGVVVGYITCERNPLMQYFTRRAIIIGGPLLNEHISSDALSALLLAVKQVTKGAIYVETRNFNDYSKWREGFEQSGFQYQPHLNFHVNTSSVEMVDKNLGKSRKRDIRTTIRDGVTPVYQPTIDQVKEYYQILLNLYTTKDDNYFSQQFEIYYNKKS